MTSAPRPDFLIIGAPKAGSTALHDALVAHPQLFASSVKEPKFYLTGGSKPDPRGQRGPGDAHSAQEWVWRRSDYDVLFRDAPVGALRYESTPFYLWDTASHERIAADLPDVKLIAVIRDPIDRAFSNWTHLWSDGLEPRANFLQACLDESRRIAAGWAPFWRYLDLGRYGEQLRHLHRHVDPERVRVVRYRQLVDAPRQTLDELCAFLGVDTGLLDGLPDSNLGRWAPHTPLNSALRRVVRLGAAAGAYAAPSWWRRGRRRLLRLVGGRRQRARTPCARRERPAPARLVGAEDRSAVGVDVRIKL